MNLILNNTRKFNSYALALDTTFKQKYATRVLLGITANTGFLLTAAKKAS